MIAHTYHNKEWTVLDLLPTEGLGILRYEIHVLLLRIFALPPHVMAWLASLCDSAAAYRDSRPQSQGLTRPKTPLGIPPHPGGPWN